MYYHSDLSNSNLSNWTLDISLFNKTGFVQSVQFKDWIPCNYIILKAVTGIPTVHPYRGLETWTFQPTNKLKKFNLYDKTENN